MLGHGGGFPGFITHTWFDPVDRLAVSVLTNAIDGAAQTAATLAVRLVGLAQEGLDGAPNDPPVADPARFTGRFTTLWGSFDVVALGGRLHGLAPSVDDPLPSRQRLAVVDDDTLRVVDGPGYGSPGEPIVYERDPDGADRRGPRRQRLGRPPRRRLPGRLRRPRPDPTRRAGCACILRTGPGGRRQHEHGPVADRGGPPP